MVDVNALTLGLAKAAAPSATAFLAKVGKNKYDQFIATYTNVFRDHIRATIERCSTVKTILHRDRPVKLDSQYVPLSFTVGDDFTLDSEVIRQVCLPGSSILVSGLAGCGKSMFMKWAALRLISDIPNTQRIPLFIEIREVPAEELSLSLDEVIFKMSSSELSKATFEQFLFGLKEGLFIVMVDGLDEVPVKHRDAILHEVTEFRRRFPRSSIICSSRPDAQLESSNSLRVLHVNSMTIKQIAAVISKALFDEDKKSAFIKALEDGLYDAHESFLSNPLLATIMLITYDIGTGVPNKLSLFYSQVYESLFYKHDSSKGVYVREHYSHLDIDEFESVFKVFCFQSYAMSRVSFLSSDLMTLIRTSLEQARVSVNPGNFLKDCKKSLCLLQEDGLFTSFVHRSFQEYFAARYLSSYGGEQYAALVDEVITRGFSDNTFEMLVQLSPEDVLRRWCLPKVIQLLGQIKEIDPEDADGHVEFFRHFASAIYFDQETGTRLSYSWAYRDAVRFVHAINDTLGCCGISARVKTIAGNVYKEGDEASAPPRFVALMEPEEREEDEDEDGDVRTTYTGRVEVRLSYIEPDFIMETGLPSVLQAIRDSLITVRTAIEERLHSTEDFARRVNALFESTTD